MKIKMELYLKGLKQKLNRVININDTLTLQEFCERSIISMNGNCKHLYQLVLNEEYAYLGSGCNVNYPDIEEWRYIRFK